MNRAQRRLAARTNMLCEHGFAKKTDGRGRPYCPHGCGFPHSQRPPNGSRSVNDPCRCWLSSPPIPHEGHCCLRDDPTPLADIMPGTPPPCGHWVEA